MVSIFFSYSHKDEALRDQLESHLALLKNQGLIDAWHDRRIVAGEELDGRIFGKLESADIILLLVSSDFISSPYCYSREMARAMERHESGEAWVIPVILRHCIWQGAPFGGLLAVPRDGKPVTAWADQDEALADVAKQVAEAVQALRRRIPAVASLASKEAPEMARGPAMPDPASEVKPRSSNLRLKKEFTESDRDEFLRATFGFVCRFFEASIEALQERNTDVTCSFERIDSRRMAAILYRSGKKIAECSVRLEGVGGRGSGLAFSYDASAREGSFNEFLSVEESEQALSFSALGITWKASERGANLSQEGAAELLWGLFIENAQ